VSSEARFLDVVLADPTVTAVLERAPALAVEDLWLAAGVLFQAVWNELTGRPPGTGVRDADLFYFDADTSWDAEDAAIRPRRRAVRRPAGAGGDPQRGSGAPLVRRPFRGRQPRRSATAPTPSMSSLRCAAATA
jgi:hypothetical protein